MTKDQSEVGSHRQRADADTAMVIIIDEASNEIRFPYSPSHLNMLRRTLGEAGISTTVILSSQLEPLQFPDTPRMILEDFEAAALITKSHDGVNAHTLGLRTLNLLRRIHLLAAKSSEYYAPYIRPTLRLLVDGTNNVVAEALEALVGDGDPNKRVSGIGPELSKVCLEALHQYRLRLAREAEADQTTTN